MNVRHRRRLLPLTLSLIFACSLLLQAFPVGALAAEPADAILYGGRVVTVDKDFTIHEAIAIQNGRVLLSGSDVDVMKTRGERTRMIKLEGRMVLPGLIDSHVHPAGAAMFEFDHPVPDMETVQDVLDYVKGRTAAVEKGKWIWVSQVFITRLREQRYPTRQELDEVAPEHPVVFRTGPDAALNSLALEACGIDKEFKVVGAGYIERDANGEPNGILRGCTRYIKEGDTGSKKASTEERDARLEMLFKDYNSVGITGVADKAASAGNIDSYIRLKEQGRMTVRMAASRHLEADGELEEVTKRIREVAAHPLAKGDDPLVKIVGIKMFLDGGMLTGSAYMRKPWGVSEIYSIKDPQYRGVRFIEQDRLVEVVQATADAGLQYTAHSVGDGAVHALLDAYAEVNKKTPIRATRPCITHCNFMSREAIEQMVKLGVVADIQPAWLYLDARTLSAQFGDKRLTYFQPLKTIFQLGAIAGGGSDHMQKIGSLRSVNPYNPFLGMWVTITRQARWFDGQLHPEQALTRQQAIRFYTANNAFITFRDDTGTLTPGQRADLIVLDRDLLECPVDDIRDTKVLLTILGGKLVYKDGSVIEKPRK